VREAVFDVLGSLLAPEGLDGFDVVDLFAGSGAFGIEALSRGAARAVFVEHHQGAAGTVVANLAATGFAGPAVRVLRSDVLAFVHSPHRFDLAFCDPPYEFDDWEELLGRLHADLAVLESNRLLTLPARWETVREKQYGGTIITVVRAIADPDTPAVRSAEKGTL
jgi:16S rRNA (guanine(966)-N(2))-methyltransferase RsmD